MKSIKWINLVGQKRIKQVFEAAFENDSLGHAYLLCGAIGVGTFAAALDLAMALLCISENSEKPCLKCSSCSKILKASHPDLHILMPLFMEKEHKTSDGKLSDSGWELVRESIQEKISNPYSQPHFSGIPTVPVEWVREINHAIMRGSIEKGKNIIIMDGVDLMSAESSNAMLKTLEEPPPNTIMLLLTERIHALLPTIISRCQILRFGYLAPDDVLNTLTSKFNFDKEDTRLKQAAIAGSISDALYEIDHPMDDLRPLIQDFLQSCYNKNWTTLIPIIDQLSLINDYGKYEQLIIEMIRKVRSELFVEFDEEFGFYSDSTGALNIPGFKTIEIAQSFLHICDQVIASIKARGNISLVLVNFAISIMEAFHGKK